ncbi:MAG TPA: DUF3515 domain-containing protein [Nocardioidaceae bacterium]|nr:DUF3515 domain-containing protein [Nocardioidaceae bacterium]
MPPRRPGLRIAGALSCLCLLLGGCARAPEISGPTLHGADADACEALVGALPTHVDGQSRRTVRRSGSYGATWGDPAIALTCGVPRPKGQDKFAACTVADGVGWFLPPGAGRDSQQITITTIGRAQNVQVVIPRADFPPAATMVDLAPAIKRTIRETHPCV